MKIIIIDKNKKLLELLKLSVEVIANTEVIPRENCSEALSMIELLGADVKLVVIYDPESEHKRKELLDYIANQLSDTYAIVVCSSLNLAHPRIKVITRINDPDHLTSIVKESLVEELRSDHIREYHSLELKYLDYFHTAPANIYFRLTGEGENEFKYIKLLNEDSDIDRDFRNKYRNKNLKYFFIKDSDREKVHKILTRQILTLFKEGKNAPAEEKVTFDELHVQAYDQLTSLGFTPATTKLAVETTQNLLSSMKNNKNLLNNLNDIYKKGASFSYRFSYMTAIVSYNLISTFPWSNEANIKSVTYAALLNDLSLSDDFIKIRSEEELKASKLSRADRDLVNHHAVNSSKILEKIRDLPPETFRIVLQHHGSLGGIGFSDYLPDQVTKLSACFIAAEEFVFRIITSPTSKINIPDIIQKMRDKFMGDSKSQIEMAIKALEQIITSK
jgi:HD-GYP domain-containing protein (c-di-GMP phosphodiesterase class II)